jgi:hypothetical protein
MYGCVTTAKYFNLSFFQLIEVPLTLDTKSKLEEKKAKANPKDMYLERSLMETICDSPERIHRLIQHIGVVSEQEPGKSEFKYIYITTSLNVFFLTYNNMKAKSR